MRLQGKVALITGAAKSQGRSHAIRLAEEGADIIAVDICRQIGFVPYPMATKDDLAETVAAVEALDRRIVAAVADVRDRATLQDAVDAGVAELGRLDIVSANAAVTSVQKYSDVTDEIWDTTLDVNLKGVWNTCSVAIPHLLAAGGGSITITSSSAGIRALPFYLPYVAAKHALVGLARTLALELSDRNIRVNTIHPTGVDTPQGHSDVLPELLDERPDLRALFMNSLPVSHIQSVDISNALLYLSSEDARYITGTTLVVDAGSTIR
jgi:SDR family mycofactocin-dependent oxidoreductase